MLTLLTDCILGDLPAEWKTQPLCELLAANYPGNWGADNGTNVVNVLRSTNLTNNGTLNLSDIAQRYLDPVDAAPLQPKCGDILLERSGGGPGQPVGRVGFVDRDLPGFAFSNFLHLLRPNDDRINRRFLGWYLYQVNRSGRIVKLEQQTTQLRNLHFRDYLTQPIPIPTSEEQGQIAATLDAVDAAIEHTRKSYDQAVRLRDGLVVDLLSLGVRSDGKVRSIHRTPEQFGTTVIGRTPFDWTVSSVGAEFEIQTGFTLNTNRRPVLNKRKYLRVANVQRARLDLSDVSELEAGEDEFQKRMLREGDLLVVEGHADSMQIGRCATVTKDASGMTFQNHLYCLRPNRVEPDFGCLWLNSPIARRYWRRVCSTTSGLNTINQRKLKRMPFPVPEKRERERICEIERAASALVTATEAKLGHLLRLKRGLMQDLLTGKVRVPASLEVAGA
jgi:type I restriction enzyme, S subunit